MKYPLSWSDNSVSELFSSEELEAISSLCKDSNDQSSLDLIQQSLRDLEGSIRKEFKNSDVFKEDAGKQICFCFY